MRDPAVGAQTVAALVTRACQLDCVYCRFRRDSAPMSPALLRRCAALLLEAPARETTLVFLGGEPLLRLREVLAAADEASRDAARRPGKALNFALTTNGLLLSSDAVDALLDRGISIQVSYDGSLQAAQRPPRGGGATAPGAVEAAIDLLVRRGARFAVHVVVSPEGVGSLRRDGLALLERGVPQLHYQYRVGVEWTSEAAAAYAREVAALALSARERGHTLSSGELMDANEPAIVSPSVTVDTDGRAYAGCAVPAMELILPALKESSYLGRADDSSLAQLAARAEGAAERALLAHRGDPARLAILQSNLAMGRACLVAERALRRALEGGRAGA